MKNLDEINCPSGMDNKNSLIYEMNEFILALEEKAEMAEAIQNFYLVSVLNKIKSNMKNLIDASENNQITMEEAYEEITHLYVFCEIYLKVEPIHIEIDMIDSKESV